MPVRELKIREPNPVLVDRLKDMLKKAEVGELQAIIGVVIFDDSNVDNFWITAPKSYHIAASSDRVVGCLERIKYQFLSMRHNVDINDVFME